MMEFEILTEYLEPFKEACKTYDVEITIKDSDSRITTIEADISNTQLVGLGIHTGVKVLKKMI